MLSIISHNVIDYLNVKNKLSVNIDVQKDKDDELSTFKFTIKDGDLISLNCLVRINENSTEIDIEYSSRYFKDESKVYRLFCEVAKEFAGDNILDIISKDIIKYKKVD